jgi:hypothetical protein
MIEMVTVAEQGERLWVVLDGQGRLVALCVSLEHAVDAAAGYVFHAGYWLLGTGVA